MHIFRKHIIQWAIGLLLITGLTTHLVIPFSSQVKKTAFAQWLDLKVEDQGNETESSLRDHIRQLPFQTESFDLLLQEASLLIIANQKEFKLPVKQSTEDSENLGQWLIKQWSIHQDHSNRQDAVVPESIFSSQKWHLQQSNFLKGVLSPSNSLHLLPKTDPLTPDFVVRLLTLPFLSGISINAP